MSRPVFIATRAVVVVLFVGCAVTVEFSATTAISVMGKPLGTALAGLLLTGALCVELVLICAWMLVGKAHDASILDDRGHADRWVIATITALGVGAFIAAVGCAYFIDAQFVEPSTRIVALALLAAVVAVCSAVMALMVVGMRVLLHRAMRQHAEL